MREDKKAQGSLRAVSTLTVVIPCWVDSIAISSPQAKKGALGIVDHQGLCGLNPRMPLHVKWRGCGYNPKRCGWMLMFFVK